MRKTARAVLNALDCPDSELSILIVDDQQIEKLNIQYLGRKGPTNVIAFPIQDGKFPNITPRLLGDIVVSAETAYNESKAAGIRMELRLDQLLVHGILHLLGYDHEGSPKDARRMEEKSNELLGLLEKF